MYLTGDVVKNPNTFPGYTIPAEKTLQLLFLAACPQTALEVSLQHATAAHNAKAAAFRRRRRCLCRSRTQPPATAARSARRPSVSSRGARASGSPAAAPAPASRSRSDRSSMAKISARHWDRRSSSGWPTRPASRSPPNRTPPFMSLTVLTEVRAYATLYAIR